MSKSFKNISIVATATMVSRVLGLGRDVLVTAVFGVEALASAFYTAFTLPNLFRRLLGEGALTAAFVPTLSEELKTRQRAGAFALVNQVASWLFVVSGSVVVVSMGLLWLLPRLVGATMTWGVTAETVQRWIGAADLGIILFPYLVCVCLAAVFSAALQTLKRFLEPALSPIWLNIAMIALLAGGAYGGWAATSEGAMLWLCAGALLGGCLQMVVPAVALRQEGWQPRFDLSVSDPLRQMVRLMGPTLFGSAIYLINISVSRLVGLSLNESAVALLNLSTRLMELPIGVFTMAVSTVIFPLIAQHAAAGDWEQLAKSYRKGLRLILVINVPAAVGLVVLATPIIRVLFERGAFAAEDTAAMRPVLVVFALALPFLSFVTIVLRAFYAQKDTATPVRAAVLSFVVNLVLSLVLMGPWGTVGLAVASNVAIVVQAIYLQIHLVRKRSSFAFHHVGKDLAKVMVGAGVMGGVVAAGWGAWAAYGGAGKMADAFGLLVLIAGGALVYTALVWWLRIEGREDLAAVLGKLRARLGEAMKFKPDWFLLGMVFVTALAWAFPGPGATGGWLYPEVLIKAGVALVFFLHGLALAFAALRAGVLNWRLHGVVQLCTYLLFPLCGLALTAVLAGRVAPELSLGVFFLCALPSTVSSSVAMTAAARGNIAGAVFNATLSSVIGVVLTPLWVAWVMKSTGQSQPIGPVILNLLCWLVLPLVVGQLLRRWLGAWVQRHKARISVVDRLTILLLVYTSFCESFKQGVWSGHGGGQIVLVTLVCVALFAFVMVVTSAVARALGFSRADRIATIFCGSKKTLAAGVPMAKLIFGAHPGIGLILLPIMIYHPLQLIVCGLLAQRWGTQDDDP